MISVQNLGDGDVNTGVAAIPYHDVRTSAGPQPAAKMVHDDGQVGRVGADHFGDVAIP